MIVTRNLNEQTRNTSIINDHALFKFTPMDLVDTITNIKHFENAIYYGLDGVPLRFIKDSIIAGYLTCIINTFAVTNQFPAAWKHATVVPIFKSGEVDEGSNYGPISLLPNLSKIVENVVASQLSACLEGRKLHSDAQLGFRKNLSTDTSPIHVSKELF